MQKQSDAELQKIIAEGKGTNANGVRPSDLVVKHSTLAPGCSFHLRSSNSVWYFGRSFCVMALMSSVAAYAFWISLAAQPMFGLVLQED